MSPYNKMFEFTNENRYFCIIYEEKNIYIRSGDDGRDNVILQGKYRGSGAG